MLSRVFVSYDKATLTRLFKTYVRPIVEYASLIRDPIERVHNADRAYLAAFTRNILGQRALDYEARLHELEIMLLAARRDIWT